MRCSRSRSFGSKRIKHLKKREEKKRGSVIIMRCGRRAQALRKGVRWTRGKEREGIKGSSKLAKSEIVIELNARTVKSVRTDGRFKEHRNQHHHKLQTP